MSIDIIIANVNKRMEEALERLKNKIMENLDDEVAEEFGEINISSFVNKAMKGFEEEIKEEISKIESKKIGKTKDKNAPKGAKNSYIFFCADNREQVKEENPEMNAKEIVSKLASLWQEADEDVKAEYQEKASQDKQRYQEQMADYVPSDEEASPKGKNSKGSAKKDPNAPKGAKNAYIFFCADNREQVKEENPEMKSTEIVSELARLWQEADEEVKAEYQEKAAQDKQRYQEEMADYVPSDEEASPKGKNSKGSAKKDPNAPKGAKNAYIFFCSEKREQVKEENSEMSAKEIISELARLWQEADEDVKAEYQEKAAQDKQRYQEEMADYVPASTNSTKGAKGSPKGGKAKDSVKRPLSSYMLFAQEYRETAKSSHPEAKATEISKILGSWWKEADEDVKAEFKEKAQRALDKFNGKDNVKDNGKEEEKTAKKPEPKEEEPKKIAKKEEKKTEKKEEPKKTAKKEEEKSPKKEEKKTEKKEDPKKTEKKEKSPKKTEKKEEKTTPKKTEKKEEEPKKSEKKEEKTTPKKTEKK